MLGLFQHCYAPTVLGMGTLVWQRVSLPEAGGVVDQDARTMASLDYLQSVHQAMSHEASKRRQKKTTARAKESRG